MYSSLIRNIFIPTLSVFRIKQVWKAYKQLKFEMSCPFAKKMQIQNQRLKILIKNLKDVKYYAPFIKQFGYKKALNFPNRFLLSVAPLTREKLQSNFSNALLNQNFISRGRLDSTSGSTGNPVSFYKDNKFENHKLATQILFNEFTGWRIGEKQVNLWGFHKTNFYGKIWNRFLYRNKIFPPYYQNNDDFQKMFYKYSKFKPTLLTGYSSALYEFADKIKQNSLFFENSLKGIIASAESLLPVHKKVIQDILKTEVFMRYGTREIDNLGMECHYHTGYHILDTRYIVEVVDENNQPLEMGKKGRILITDLFNHVMPFVRYEIGDSGSLSLENCDCGIEGLKINSLIGRSLDFIPISKEISFPVLALNIILEQSSVFIKNFQLDIRKEKEWILNVIPRKKHITGDVIRSILLEFQKYTKNKVKVEFSVRNKLQYTKSGKLPLIIR